MSVEEHIRKAQQAQEDVRRATRPAPVPLLYRLWFPHKATPEKRLFRCSCGSLYWNDYPQDIAQYHVGHTCKLSTTGTVWEVFKIKTRLLYPIERLAKRIGWR